MDIGRCSGVARVKGGGRPNVLDATNSVKVYSPYLVGEFSVIIKGEEIFTISFVPEHTDLLP